MDGLLVHKRFALKLVTGKKKTEYRRTPLPKNKTNVGILILTPKKNGCEALGTVVFTGFKKISDKNFEWIATSPVRFDTALKYVRKNGCIIWLNDVKLLKVSK